MSNVSIPNYEQWGKMNDYLNSIAVSLGTQVDISTWEGIQNAVRLGIAPDVLPIGTQLKTNHSVYGEIIFDVVAHNHFKSADNESAPTMTLLSHDVFSGAQFDFIENLYYAETELPAGTYNFTLSSDIGEWKQGTYQFTLTQALPKGGHLFLNGGVEEEVSMAVIESYNTQASNGYIESCGISSGSNGESLGSFRVELNDLERVLYGSNNYKESAIRQFLNSSAGEDSVWYTPPTKFDVSPITLIPKAGFMNGLDSDFLAVVGKVIIPCSANDTYESPDSTITKGDKYTLTDKFYLPSLKEIFGISDNTVADDSVQFPYYIGATKADYIKYRGGTPSGWCLRSANRWGTATVRSVTNSGTIGSPHSSYSNYVAVACTIV